MITLNNISLSYGEQTVLRDFSLHIAPGETVALMGPSGCGKTTLLHIMAGLLQPESGTVSVAGRVAPVFQEPALFPTLTAAENINVVLSDRKSTLSFAQNRLKLLDLYDHRDKLPSELSGGQKQRVSILRALSYGGDILLLDEAFRGLDGAAKAKAIDLIRSEWKGKTLLLVTHDESEAKALCQRLLVYQDGVFIEKEF